jgi:hypothetical protein
MTKLTFEMSEDSRLLIARLEKALIGDTITLAELSTVIGKDIKENRGALYSARRIVLAERGIVFGSERGVGIKRLSDDEILASTASDRKAIRGKATRSMHKLNSIDYMALPKVKQIAVTAIMAVFNAARVLTTERSVRQISNVANSQSLNFRATLDAFRAPKNKEE